MGVMRKVLNWYARLSPERGGAVPPYKHVAQIGDPILRRTCSDVPLDKIKTKEIQEVVKQLQHVIIKYGSVGMSAPQVGVNSRIFAMMFTSKQFASLSSDIIKNKGVQTVPFTVFINPTMKVLDYNKVIEQEGCESVRGFTALVARYKKVQITGYDSSGEQHTKEYSDWTARIAQHELDHLDGIVYTDIMQRKSLECTCWEEVNMSQGKVVMPYSPE